MGSILTNGVFLPAEGERNCYEGLAANWTALDRLIGGYNVHISNTTIHVTAEDKATWNGKADASALTAHTGDTTIHVTAEDKNKWNGKADASALTAHTGNATIHVTAAEKETWNGKADNSALTAHTGDTTIHVTSADKQAWDGHVADLVKHVTAEDKNKWDAVTSKANDSDVVHKSGNETISGNKTFSKYITSDGSSTGDEYSPNARTNLWLMGNRDTEEVSGVLFDIYRQNTAQGTGSHILGISIKENSVRYEGCRFAWGWKNDLNGYSFDFNPTTQGANQALKHNLGTSRDKWDTINGLNPSSLGMPDLGNGIDISGYITHLDKVVNNYTPPSNGWLSIRVKKTSLAHTSVMIYQTGGLLSSCETTEFSISGTNLPVIANQNVEIHIYADALVEAKFYPCQGNV